MHRKIGKTTLGVGGIALAVAACGGGGGGGPTGPATTEVAGHYSVVHGLTIGGVPFASCGGVMDLEQTGSTFSGPITITAPGGCDALASQGTILGSVAGSGALTFAVDLPKIDQLLADAGCTILSGGTTFVGTATTAGLTGTRQNRVRCVIDGTPQDYDVEYTISGTKS